jgi:hypothetical protein
VSLTAPLRLNATVREATAALVGTLNTVTPAVLPMASGVFIPLHAFERRRVAAALAIRSLAEVGMLVHAQSGGPPTQTLSFMDAMTLGLVVKADFVVGVDWPSFASAAAISASDHASPDSQSPAAGRNQTEPLPC